MDEKKALKGLKNSHWPGRFEVIRNGNTRFLLDGAHNPESARALVKSLNHFYAKAGRVLIFGTAKDKKSEDMLKILRQYFEHIIVTRAASNRSQEIGVLLGQARKKFQRVYPAENTESALKLSQQVANHGELVVITGSFFLIGEARNFLCRN